jgi:hypothetical protein
MTTQSPNFSDFFMSSFHMMSHGYMAKTKSIRMLYAGIWSVKGSKCVTRYVSPTISAFLEVVQRPFGEADVQSVGETIDLITADMAPFEQHLNPCCDQHMSTPERLLSGVP